MAMQTLIPDATSPARRKGVVLTSLVLPTSLRSRRRPTAARTPSDRAARRAAAREIASYPATRSAAAVLPVAGRSTV
jgi:hypothetical protein